MQGQSPPGSGRQQDEEQDSVRVTVTRGGNETTGVK